jgi:hypothetical protein
MDNLPVAMVHIRQDERGQVSGLLVHLPSQLGRLAPTVENAAQQTGHVR